MDTHPTLVDSRLMPNVNVRPMDSAPESPYDVRCWLVGILPITFVPAPSNRRPLDSRPCQKGISRMIHDGVPTVACLSTPEVTGLQR